MSRKPIEGVTCGSREGHTPQAGSRKDAEGHEAKDTPALGGLEDALAPVVAGSPIDEAEHMNGEGHELEAHAPDHAVHVPAPVRLRGDELGLSNCELCGIGRVAHVPAQLLAKILERLQDFGILGHPVRRYGYGHSVHLLDGREGIGCRLKDHACAPAQGIHGFGLGGCQGSRSLIASEESLGHASPEHLLDYGPDVRRQLFGPENFVRIELGLDCKAYFSIGSGKLAGSIPRSPDAPEEWEGRVHRLRQADKGRRYVSSESVEEGDRLELGDQCLITMEVVFLTLGDGLEAPVYLAQVRNGLFAQIPGSCIGDPVRSRGNEGGEHASQVGIVIGFGQPARVPFPLTQARILGSGLLAEHVKNLSNFGRSLSLLGSLRGATEDGLE